MSPLTRFPFVHAASGFFELPIDVARRLAPARIEPIEMRHGSSVLSISAFDFRLEAGIEYQQLLMSVVVAPYADDGGAYPSAALYPFAGATSNPLVREEAVARWHLPQWEEETAIELKQQAGSLIVSMTASGAPVLDLTVHEYRWMPASALYQCFMATPAGRLAVRFSIEGEQSEHEEGLGLLRLHDHPFNRELQTAEVDETPMREVWIRDGVQSFEEPIQLPDA